MIVPTVGRQVWFWSGFDTQDQPQAATIAYVWDDELVNLSVCSPDGNYNGKTSVRLWQGKGVRPEGQFCEWMPYQIKAAAKQE